MPVLFDQVERTEIRLKRENESTFSYLNLSARVSSAALQSLENAYICCGHKAMLKRQFRWNNSVISSRSCTP